MAPLRWILLLAGLVFIGTLLWWESRRGSRGVNAPDVVDSADGGTNAGAVEPAPVDFRERREERSLPIIDLPSLTPQSQLPAQPQSQPLAQPQSQPPRQGRIEPTLGDLPDAGLPESDRPGSDVQAPTPSLQPDLIVEWPPERERRILSLRLVSRGADRFAGRALRQALSACGFLHGRFGIYHLPAADGRAVLSAASLSLPGILDPENMDFQRFAGLNLFAVLPGVLSSEKSLERLVAVAAELADRLGGLLQDEHGAPLDAARLDDMRRALEAPSQAEADADVGDGAREPQA